MARKPARIRPEWTRDEAGMTRLVDPAELPPKFYALAYTWREFRVYRTRKAATRALVAWKRLQESRGWTVKGSQNNGYAAYAPYYATDAMLPGMWGNCAAANVHTYEDGRRIA